MKRLIIILIFAFILALPVSAAEFTAPSVPQSGSMFMPDETESFAQGLWFVIKSAIQVIRPEVSDAAQVCLRAAAIVVLISVISSFSEKLTSVCTLVGVIALGSVLLRSADTLIQLGTDTVRELSEYGKLLLPVMTAAVAAQGGAATSAALYGGTVFFSTLLSTVITKCMIPLLYIYLALSIAGRGVSQDLLSSVQASAKSTLTWVLKAVLYVFTGYMSITGVVSGTADAAAVKAAKLTISGAVPVVGSILSDASEAVLVGAGLVKNSVGIYGLLAVVSVCIGPFLKIAVQYLLLKITAGACSLIGNKQTVALLQDFSGAMGVVLAMVGTQCVLLLVSTVCFMKGVG